MAQATDSKLESYENMNGATKAAVLVLALDRDASTIILKQMPSKAVEDITREVASL